MSSYLWRLIFLYSVIKISILSFKFGSLLLWITSIPLYRDDHLMCNSSPVFLFYYFIIHFGYLKLNMFITENKTISSKPGFIIFLSCHECEKKCIHLRRKLHRNYAWCPFLLKSLFQTFLLTYLFIISQIDPYFHVSSSTLCIAIKVFYFECWSRFSTGLYKCTSPSLKSIFYMVDRFFFFCFKQ